MIDFKKQQMNIKKYISDNLPYFLSEMGLSNLDAYIDDYLDLDKYPKPKQMFFDFGFYNNDYLSNESISEDFQFMIVLAFKSAKQTALKDNMLDYTTAFCKMFEESGYNLGGIADYGLIESVNFYSAVEGNPDIKIAELSIRLHTER